jgi:calcium/proton exchanger cax
LRQREGSLCSGAGIEKRERKADRKGFHSFGSIVEIILFLVLLVKDQFIVIQAAILGSILATMLLCLGLCFIAGGIRRDESTFSHAISEAGNGLLLTAYASPFPS